MPEKPRDLQERTAQFAEAVRTLVRLLPRTLSNIEANEALGDKDRLMRFRICRKEAKESQLWLRLLDAGQNVELGNSRAALFQEAHELKLILTTIIKKLE
jgi:four helix bundle protein